MVKLTEIQWRALAEERVAAAHASAAEEIKTKVERPLFEKWWLSHPASDFGELDRAGNGYVFDGVQAAWDAWQARAMLAARKGDAK